MPKRGLGRVLSGMALWAGTLAWADAPVQAPSPSTVNPLAIANPQTPAGKSGSASASASSSASKEPKSPALASASASAASPGNTQGTLAPKAAPVAGAAKTALADAFIAQSVLRVYLDRPAAVSVYNSRGQLVFQVDSRRAMEAVPLQGISTGFIYLTVRTAQGELTKKLVNTGK